MRNVSYGPGQEVTGSPLLTSHGLEHVTWLPARQGGWQRRAAEDPGRKGERR